MSNKERMEWTRREFVVVGSGAAALVTAIHPASAAVFSAAERERLIAAMDELIPAADGMPSASQAGCLGYLESVAAEIEGLAGQFRAAIVWLKSDDSRPLTQVLQALEREEPQLFATLRDFIYEAYYTRPEVWKRIGYSPHLTHQRGPEMKPFDASVLDRVRQLGKLYVEVG